MDRMNVSDQTEITNKTIITVYEMLYPYGHYNGDISLACRAIHQKIKMLCTEDNRYPLLIIGRYLKLKYNHDTSITQICNDIKSIINLSDNNSINENIINMKLLDWMDITYVIGFSDNSEIFIEDINYIVSDISSDDSNGYITDNIDKDLLKDKYLYAYSRRVGVLDFNIAHRQYILIIEVLDLMNEGKIPINASYDEIEKYL